MLMQLLLFCCFFCNVHPACHNMVNGIKPGSNSKETDKHAGDCSKAAFLFVPRREKTGLWGFANNQGAYKPVHPRSLISAFVIRLLESIIPRLVTREVSIV